MRIPSLYKHSYELVHDGDDTEDRKPRSKALRSSRPRRCWGSSGQGRFVAPAAMFVLVTVALAGLAFWWYPALAQPRTDCARRDTGYQCQPKISHHWGQYSPFFSVPTNIAAELPKNCELRSVQILSRHGARYPTLDKSIEYANLIVSLQNKVKEFHGNYQFLKDYKYSLGSEDLTRFGQQELVDSGAHFYARYRSLTSKNPPFVRAAGAPRVVMSAQNFTQGFHQARLQDQSPGPADGYPYPILTISEGDGQNNTLNHGLCDAFEDSQLGSEKSEAWRARFAPAITRRLNADLPGAALDDGDTVHLMAMCPFDTVAAPDGRVSPFCALFSAREFRDYDYMQSVAKYYGYGPGNPLGPTQGVGYANEVIARLTGRPVRDRTSVNRTLDADPRAFPLGPQATVFADFSHDNDMAGIFAALGLYNATRPLPTERYSPAEANAGFSAAWTVPFGARAYIEKMACAGADEELVRVLVNDRVVPLQACGADKLGRCTLSSFVDSLSFAAHGGRWDECFA